MDRIQPIIRGALHSDMVALHLRMMHKLFEAPSFSELLRKVREEEVHNRNTVPASVTVSSVSFNMSESTANVKPIDSEVEKLRKEVRGLKSGISHLLAGAVVPVSNDSPKMQCLASTPERIMANRAGGGSNFFCYKCGEDGHLKT